VSIRWTKTALSARLEALEEKHSGDDLIDAVVSFADTLTTEDRRLLQDVLLERASRGRRFAPHWTDDMRSRFFGLPPRGRRRGPR
jgi:uncharacterized membrane protein